MTPSARSRAWYGLPATAAAVVAVVALTGGMAWLGHRVSDAGPQVPRPAPGRSLDLTLTYVGTTPAGPRLFTEVHRVPDSRKSALTVAISALMTDSPRDDDFRNYLLASHMSAKATQDKGIVTIDFAAPPRRTPDLDDAKARVVIQALVHTADDAVGSDAPVRFAVAGDPVDSVFGVDTTRPVEPLRGDGIDSPVSIESPADNAFLRSGSSVLGRASTADGRVYWAVYRTEWSRSRGPRRVRAISLLRVHAVHLPAATTAERLDVRARGRQRCRPRQRRHHRGHQGVQHQVTSLDISGQAAARSSARSWPTSGPRASRAR